MPWNIVEHRGTPSNWMEHMELIQGSVARQLLVVPGVQCLTKQEPHVTMRCIEE